MMALPESCIECPLAKWEYYTCYCPILEKTFYDDKTDYSTHRRRECPLPKILK